MLVSKRLGTCFGALNLEKSQEAGNTTASNPIRREFHNTTL
jgi:hypothetical protein